MKYKVGGVIGCFLDLYDKTISKSPKNKCFVYVYFCIKIFYFLMFFFCTLFDVFVLMLVVCVYYPVLKFQQEEKVYSNTAESFGKQWQVGDVVGVFLDLIDHTISKNFDLASVLLLLFLFGIYMHITTRLNFFF